MKTHHPSIPAPLSIVSILVVCVTIGILSSCAPSSIRTAKDAEFKKKISRIYVKIYQTNATLEFLGEFGTALQTEFRKDSIECGVKWFRPVTVEDTMLVLKAISDFHPDVILQVGGKLKSSADYGSYAIAPVAFESGSESIITMLEPGSDHPVWTALMSSGNGGWGGAGNGADAAKRLLRQLKTDGMIGTGGVATQDSVNKKP